MDKFQTMHQASIRSFTDQLHQCCEASLRRLIIREQPDILSKDENTLLKSMKGLAVIKVANSVRRSKLLSTRQSHGEGFREFYANVKAAASTCNFKVKCPNECCQGSALVDYTSSVVKDVIVLGIADPDIRKDVLAWEELDEKDDKALVAFVETKELARNAWMSSQTSAAAAASSLSSYRRGTDQPSEDASIKGKLNLKGKCTSCKKAISLYKKYQSGKMNKKPFTQCQSCFKAQDQQSKVSGIQTSEGMHSESDMVSSFFVCAYDDDCRTAHKCSCASSSTQPGGWECWNTGG